MLTRSHSLCCHPAAELISTTDPSTVTEHGQFCREAEACQTYVKGCVALTGDAAHLATPFLGQGCSQALEDALELGRAIGQHGPTAAALQAYQAVRVPMASDVQAASVEVRCWLGHACFVGGAPLGF